MFLKVSLIFSLSITAAQAAYFSFSRDCKVERIFEAASGTLKYPEGGGNYANYDHACFFFSCPAGKRATLTWRAFDVGSSDSILVAPADGINRDYGSQIRHSGGGVFPPDTSFYRDGTYLEFTSGGNRTGTGFEVDWGCHEDPPCPLAFNFPTSCKSTSTLDSLGGELTYPEHPSYSNSESACFFFCCPRKRLTLKWLRFEVEQGWDFVTAYPVKGNAALPDYILRHSNYTRPSDTVVEMDGIFLQFTSDNNVTDLGFRLSWTCQEMEGQPIEAVPLETPLENNVITETVVEEGPVDQIDFSFPQKCKTGTIIDDKAGTLNYPSGGGSYSNSEIVCFFFSCPEMGATLTWKTFETEKYFDHVFAFPVSGNTVGATAVLPPHSGSSLPPDTVVEQDGLLLVFKSDHSLTGMGFELDWMCSEDTL